MKKKQTKKKVRKYVIRFSLVAFILAIIYFVVIPGVSFYIGYLEAQKYAEKGEYRKAREVWNDSVDLSEHDIPLFGIYDYYDGIHNDINNEVDSWVYDKANNYYMKKDYDKALDVLYNYFNLDDYFLVNHEVYVSEKYILARKCYYEKAILLEESGRYEEAHDMFRLINGFEDSIERMVACDRELTYLNAVTQYEAKKYVEALSVFEALSGFKDSAEFYTKCQEGIYHNALSLYNNRDFESTIELLNNILEYKDSKDLCVLCEKEISYNKAINYYNAGQYNYALETFDALGDFSDSAEWYEKSVYAYAEYYTALGQYDKAEKIYNKVLSEQESAELVIEGKYKNAVQLYESSSYEKAVELFREIGNYKDSADLIEKCFDGQVECFVQEGNFSSAQELLSTYKTVEETDKIIFTGKYDYACLLKETKKYTEALTLFQEIIDFSDSTEQIKQLEKLIFIETLNAASDGSLITLGKYEQDGSYQNGEESIQWRVIAKESGKMLVISEYGLDTYPYNLYANGTIWSESNLYLWMNNSFYESAFSTCEKEFILETDSSLGKLFALNVDEAYRYMSKSERKCRPTRYAKNNGAMTNLDKTLCYWWTRELHSNSSYTVAFCPDGEETMDGVFYVKYKMNNTGITARPAMWLDLNVDTLN